MSTTVITPDQAAVMFLEATSSQAKWEFMDAVAAMVAANPGQSQRATVDQIGDTAKFIEMHGHHRDSGDIGKKARSKMKSICDELAVVKVWDPADRVEGVSFEAHKVLNRLGSKAGNKILNQLATEAGGPGNVTKAAVTKRLKEADPDHKPQANGKSSAQNGAAGNQPVTSMNLYEHSAEALALALAEKLTVGELSKDTGLASAVEKVADIYEAFTQRKAAKAKASKPTPKKAAASSRRKSTGKPSVKRPSRATAKPKLAAKAAS